MRFKLLLSLLAVLPAYTCYAEFGLVSDKKAHRIDSGAGLVLQIDRASGDLRSIRWRNTEMQSPERMSGLNSGMGRDGTSVVPSVKGDVILVTVTKEATHPAMGGLTHYYMVRKGLNHLYMATHAVREPSVGELRWITRMKGDLFTNVPPHSEIRGTKGSIESRDVLGMADGTSRSKYYGNEPAQDLAVRGVSGPGRGVFMVYGNRESSAGGPFFRDIQNQRGSSAEVYNYMNSGHLQTEKLRLSVMFGPYALYFTDGETPSAPDMSFVEELDLKGLVKKSQRGRVVLDALSGMDASYKYTLGLSNSTAQYWASVNIKSGEALCEGVKPGQYQMQVYKGELAVLERTLEVKAGEATRLGALTIEADPSAVEPLWRIGEWDGTPLEFRNGRNISLMHPSDVRMAKWKTGDYTVGTSKTEDFPSCFWRGVNDRQVIKFHLKEEQLKQRTLRVGITVSFAGARPVVQVNQWKARQPKAPRKLESRSLTIGSYRGNNQTFTFTVPADALVAGENSLTLSVISGNGGSQFLAPSLAIDCIDLH